VIDGNAFPPPQIIDEGVPKKHERTLATQGQIKTLGPMLRGHVGALCLPLPVPFLSLEISILNIARGLGAL